MAGDELVFMVAIIHDDKKMFHTFRHVRDTPPGEYLSMRERSSIQFAAKRKLECLLRDIEFSEGLWKRGDARP